MPKISQDTTQKLLITLYLTLDAYRILIGSFYSIFVPQSCPDYPDATTYHTCTLSDNVTDLTIYNTGVIGINAVTAFLMAIGFVQEYRRENWMVKHLEVDPKKPDAGLATEIEAYPRLKASLMRKNHNYKILFSIIALLSIVNITTSGILVFDYYDGLKTATTFITNTLLILGRVIKSIQTSRLCDKELRAQSVYLLEQVTFNTIDPDYIVKDRVETAPKMIDNPQLAQDKNKSEV